MAKISGGGENSRLWAFSSAKKVLLTAEKVGDRPPNWPKFRVG